jgi:glucose-6-phosphate 1-dehydrogenase
MQFNPDRIDLHLNVTGADELFSLHETALEKQLARQTIPAYGQVLLDVIQGDQTLSIRDDETEESWRIVQPILDAWAQGRSPLREYDAGSDGPVNG